MSLRDEISDLIGDFYDGEINASQFREKFARMYYDSDSYVSEVQELFGDIDAIYAEYITHRIEEAELKQQLFKLLPSIRVVLPKVNDSPDLWNIHTTSSSTQTNSARLPSSPSKTLTVTVA